MLDSAEKSLEFNPQPTKASNSSNSSNSIPPNAKESNIKNSSEPTLSSEHPPMFDDDDDVLRKCKKDAIRNSIKITEAQTTQAQTTQPQTTQANLTISNVFNKYKIPLIIITIFIALLIIGIIANYFMSGNTNSLNN